MKPTKPKRRATWLAPEVKSTVYLGDCRKVMRKKMAAESVDSIVTDPPYGLSFMGKGWDHAVPGPRFWREALRVAKPGAHLVAFGGTRTFHRLVCAIEDAGWEIRDTLVWCYSSGFPKSLNVAKALDKAAGVAPTVVGSQKLTGTARIKGDTGKAGGAPSSRYKEGELRDYIDLTTPTSEQARRWDGWGTALKPCWEPILLARKPLAGTVVETVLAHGTGAINVDACRIGESGGTRKTGKGGKPGVALNGSATGALNGRGSEPIDAGRWPSNLLLDGSEAVVRSFPMVSVGGQVVNATSFFYSAKATKSDRGEGNDHPTVKPTDVMRWLCRLVTQPGGVVLDPFCGSGSTGKAAILEGLAFVGIEQNAESAAVAARRSRAGVVTAPDLSRKSG